jgi:hypothetical protein
MSAARDSLFVVEDWESPHWRLNHLYTIVDDEGAEVPFRMNGEQEKLFANLWTWNLVLKARQVGCTTLVALMALDQCLFNTNFSAGVIAHNLDDATKIFRNKVKAPYDKLPEALREKVPLASSTSSELVFANGSSIGVGTSMRSGTLQFLHISEFGKICAKFPDKAKEIVTGSFPTLKAGQFLFVESTAEGQEGYFYEYARDALAAQKEGRQETVLDFRLHFFPWWEKKANAIDPTGVVIDDEMAKYFVRLEKDHGIRLAPEQKAWYVRTEAKLKGDMKREHPSYCIAGTEPVFSPAGITQMKDVPVDGATVTRFFDQGEKPVFTLTTELGYELTCTADHRIKTQNGFVEAQYLKPGDPVLLGLGAGGGSPQIVTWHPLPCIESRIAIDEDFAEFVGFFMGDGSLGRDVLSVVCTAEDVDVIDRVKTLIRQHFGCEPGSRAIGSNAGGVEIRVANVRLKSMFSALGLLRENGSGGMMRKVHVPDFIKRSPTPVVRAFLRGLFEADGFAQRDGTGVKFFTKYADFARDVQLLLLRFDITCRRARHDKHNSAGYTYEGWELTLRTAEAAHFSEAIGFVSARKQARAMIRKDVADGYRARRLRIDGIDTVRSIVPAGVAPTFDITTDTHEFVAGGIVVHNCEEAFEVAIDGVIYARELELMRRHGQITDVPWDPSLPVNTFWDLGLGDAMSLWFHQRVGMQNRLIRYFEDAGEGLSYYVNEIRSHGYTMGTHYLPHDADNRLMGENVETTADILRRLLPGQFVVVDRIREIKDGLNKTREFLPSCWIDRTNCAAGIKALDSYRYEWDEKLGRWKNHPLHNWASHAADALRQGAQGFKPLGAAEPGGFTRHRSSWRA